MFSQEVSASFCYRLVLSERRHPFSNLKRIPHNHLCGVVILYTRLERLVLNSIHRAARWLFVQVWYFFHWIIIQQDLLAWWERSLPANVAWVRFWRGAICGLSLLLVVNFSEGFSSGFPVFLPSQKPTSQFDQNRGPAWKPAKADMSSLEIF